MRENKKYVQKVANNANRNPLDTDLTKETSEKLKEFKKICKKEQSSFWETLNNELRDSENDTFGTFGKNVKKTLHKIRTLKLLMVKNGRNITQTFSAILTKGIKPHPKTQSKRKYQKIIPPFLINELTKPQELGKILKILKRGKCEGKSW